MFSNFSLFALLSCIFILTACGGGSKTSSNKDIEPKPTNNSINGVINAAASMNFDSDLNDRNTQYVNNSSPSRAQAIQNLVTIHGFVNETPTKFFATYYDDRSSDRFYSSTDKSDVFRVQLQAGQRVQLQVVNYYDQLDTGEVFAGDIDLELFNSAYESVDSSDLVQEFESVIAPSNGLYFINVSAFEGASRYVLQILPSEEQINDTSANTAPDKMNFVPNQLIIQHKAPNSIKAFNQSIKTLHTGVTRPTLAYLDDSSDVSIRSNSDPFLSELSHLNPDSFQKIKTLRQLKTLKKQDNILDASLNYIRYTQKTPSDTYYNYQWHYTSMNLPQAWDITTGTPTTGSVVVAVIDTGIYSSHPDLRNKLINGYDFISNTGNSGDNESGIDDNPEDTGDGQDIGSSSWHGTHVAGTIAAETNNNLGVAGVSWGAKIMPLRALGKNGGTSYDISQAVRFAAGLENDSGTVPEKRADIINLSIGGSGSSSIEATLY